MEGTVVTQFGVPSPHFWCTIPTLFLEEHTKKKSENLRQIAGFGSDIGRRHRPEYDA
jgi:hypothetical protein